MKCVAATGDALGESALWDPDTARLYWIDGVGGTIHWLQNDGALRSVQPPIERPLGMIALGSEPGTLVIADALGVGILNLERGSLERCAAPEAAREGIYYNDGKVDSAGRLWLGTYDPGEVEPRGVFWRINGTDAPILVESGAAVFNGPAFSPDGTRLYLSDSVARRIIVFDVATSVPYLRNRRVFATFGEAEGLPDGLTCDADGGLWVAHWGGAKVSRFAPDGALDLVIQVPATNVTSVTFGGATLQELFITTARFGLEPHELQSQPEAGHVFSCRPGPAGVAAFRCVL